MTQNPGCAYYLYGDQNTKTLLQIKYSGGHESTSCTLREKETKEKQFMYKIVMKTDEGLLNLSEFYTSVVPLLLLFCFVFYIKHCISSSMKSK